MSRREWAYPRIATVRHLPNYPNEDQAYRMLNRICEEAQETMERHDMFINVVAEFYPPDDSIYGVNAESGRLVRVRLREPHRRREFLPYDMVYGVFLHELCHNFHGHHQAPFHQLLRTVLNENNASRFERYNELLFTMPSADPNSYEARPFRPEGAPFLGHGRGDDGPFGYGMPDDDDFDHFWWGYGRGHRGFGGGIVQGYEEHRPRRRYGHGHEYHHRRQGHDHEHHYHHHNNDHEHHYHHHGNDHEHHYHHEHHEHEHQLPHQRQRHSFGSGFGESFNFRLRSMFERSVFRQRFGDTFIPGFPSLFESDSDDNNNNNTGHQWPDFPNRRMSFGFPSGPGRFHFPI